MDDFLNLLSSAEASGQGYAVAIVVRTEGSTSGKPGAKAVILEDGTVLGGWVGGGCVESSVIQESAAAIRDGKPRTIDLDLTDELRGLGMPCGGRMTVYIEPRVRPRCLVLLGHNSITRAVARIGAASGFRIVVDDTSAVAADYPAGTRLITDDIEYAGFPVSPNSFIVVATHHRGDHRAIEYAIRQGARYIALIASRQRAKIVLDMVRELGVPEGALSVVCSPAGLDLGAKTPEEIALAIVAEIVHISRRGALSPASLSVLAASASRDRGDARWSASS